MSGRLLVSAPGPVYKKIPVTGLYIKWGTDLLPGIIAFLRICLYVYDQFPNRSSIYKYMLLCFSILKSLKKNKLFQPPIKFNQYCLYCKEKNLYNLFTLITPSHILYMRTVQSLFSHFCFFPFSLIVHSLFMKPPPGIPSWGFLFYRIFHYLCPIIVTL